MSPLCKRLDIDKVCIGTEKEKFMRIEELLFNDNICKCSFLCVDDEGEWTVDALRKRVNNLSNILLRQNVKKTDCVGVLVENSASFIVCMMAILRIGAKAVLLDPQLPKNSSDKILMKTRIKVLCVSGQRPENNYGKIEASDYMVLNEKVGDWNCENDYFLYDTSLSDTEAALIMPTSGTTGSVKAVVLSHKAVVLNVKSILEYMVPKEEDVFFVTKTMVHSSTISGEILVALAAGAKLITMNPRVSVRTIIKRINLCQTTILCLNPTILHLFCMNCCREEDFSSVRLVYTSGAIATKSLLEEAQTLFKNAEVLNVYGLTEAGPRVTAERVSRRNGSVGKPINGVEIFIRKPNGLNCDVNEEGIVFVKTKSLMLEYYEDIQSTQNKVKDGLLNTNDIGFIDSEGDLHIVGRADEMIITGAHNVHPNNIEEAIYSKGHLFKCIVFGIPDEAYGEKIICAMEKNSAICNQTIYALECCKEKLAPYEIPHEFCVWDKIPQTPSGKVSRYLSRNKYFENMKQE